MSFSPEPNTKNGLTSATVGTRVACCGGWAGTLQGVLTAPDTSRVTHLLIEITSSVPTTCVVPVQHVIAAGYETIFLDLTHARLASYHEDSAQVIGERC